jgi:hypothetical protein
MDRQRNRITFHLDGRKFLVDDCILWYDEDFSYKFGWSGTNEVSALEVEELVGFWGIEFVSLIYTDFDVPEGECMYYHLDVYLERGGGFWIYVLNKMVYGLFTEPLDMLEGSSFFRGDSRIHHLAISMFDKIESYPFVLSVGDLLETREVVEEALRDLISWNPKVRGHSLFKRLQRGVDDFSKFMVG